jgi:hypothetical protein
VSGSPPGSRAPGPLPAAVATVRTKCPACAAWNSFEADAPLEAIGCGGCGAAIPLVPSEGLLAGGPVDRCWRCGREEFWTKKDFPQQWGLAIVALAAVGAFWTYGATLLLAAIVDAALYYALPPMAVCYICKTEYRGVPVNPAHGSFDIEHEHALENEEHARRRATRGPEAPDAAAPEAAP